MKLRSAASLLILTLALGGYTAASAEPQPVNGPLLGDYLAGSYASYIDDAAARADYYYRAYNRAPDDLKLGRLAMTSALNNGQFDQAKRIAAKLYSKNKNNGLSRVLLGADAFAKGRHSKAEKYLKASSTDLIADILRSLLLGWNQAEQGKTDKARETFQNIGGANYFDGYGQLQIAKLEIEESEWEAADKALKIVEEAGLSPVEALLTRARLELARGDRDAALAALEAFKKDNPRADSGPISAALKTLQSGKDIPVKLSAQQHAARALVDPAFAFFIANRSTDGGEIYLRVARQIDPDYDKGAIWLGALLEDTERDEEAYGLYEGFSKGSPYYVSARLNQANILFARDEDDKALAILEKLAKSHPSFTTREAVGRARFFRENYAEALPFYDKLVGSMSDAELKDNIEPLRLRGIIYERIGQWDLAEKDFKKVLEIEPENVDTLNYLGYTWVDRGENLTEAFEMIRKAVAKQPKSGAIVDSLGWAHYKLGQYKEAKDKLEDAAALSPSSATIIDHLGDVYWKLGRKREAGYQWERALEFDPTDEERALINRKLVGGLEAVQ